LLNMTWSEFSAVRGLNGYLGFCKPWVRRGLFKTLTPVPGGLAFSLGAACVTVEKGQKTSLEPIQSVEPLPQPLDDPTQYPALRLRPAPIGPRELLRFDHPDHGVQSAVEPVQFRDPRQVPGLKLVGQPVPSPHRQAQHGFTRRGQLLPDASHQIPADAQVVGDRAIRAGGVGADRVGGKLPPAHDHAARPFGTLAWWFLHGDLPAVIRACSSGTPFVTPKN